jgi:hypothetical protein
VPCADSTADERTVIEYSDDADHPNHPEDDCSPFCSCACCGLAMFFEMHETSMEIAVKLIIEHLFNYQPPFTKSYHSSVWHPPALLVK